MSHWEESHQRTWRALYRRDTDFWFACPTRFASRQEADDWLKKSAENLGPLEYEIWEFVSSETRVETGSKHGEAREAAWHAVTPMTTGRLAAKIWKKI